MPSLKSSSIQAMLALAASTSALPTLQKRAQAAENLCGMPDDSLILTGTPWIVYNMMYNSAQIEGSACTGYVGTTTDANGNPAVKWNSTWNIEYVQSTDNVPKGYSFVGLTQNLENRISDIGSIPTTYEWTRTNTTAYKGNVCYDFMTSDTKGDSTSSNAQELMLWLQYEGGQLPIGWTDGAVATIDNLYGTSWKLYQGKNEDTGITVSSLLPDTQFTGSFSGDIKDWLLALVKQGVFTESTYVNVGNAGTEPFYGDAVFEATLGLQVNVGSSSSVAPVSSVAPTTTAAPSSTKAPASTEAPVSTEVATSSTPAVAPSSAVAINIPSSSSTLAVEYTPTPLATSTAAATTPASAAASSAAVDGANASSSSSVEAPASYTTSPAAETPALSTPAIPTTSAADSAIPTGNSGHHSGSHSFAGNGAAAPTPGFDAGVSGENGQGQSQGLAPAEGDEDGPCAVEYIYV
ncbi:Family 12 glycoside hydrolase protein [Lasiodiplodia theobromae]|uniref:Family 12 glycoside hydrolase protein n=1 Tax=Lasiodiplodia theobromae TaxID=45133 RepID=UPI0015C317B3|nr:Family 12 glycoside hydrolase protein [Lasiodiplodia theobromae]KAF4542113.1 Family 12 glycoside hydrolase protein [Lasiodiplodia theobromae]